MLGSIFQKTALLVGALAISASAAFAASGDVAITKTLNTSPLYTDAGKSYHACIVAAVTTTSVGVKIDLVDSSGNVMQTTGSSPYTITAGTVYELGSSLLNNYTGFARCRILVYNGNTDEIRANETVFYYTGSYYQTLAVSEAR